VRKIVCLFCRSPVKNDLFQKYAMQDLGKELTVIVDCKTRWSSLLAMLNRFLVMRGVVQKNLIDLNMSLIFLSNNELVVVSNLVKALDVVECGTRAVCRRDTTLASADQIFAYMIQALRKQKTTLA
jgi:DNA gyrase/topoisomerase IV subunit A